MSAHACAPAHPRLAARTGDRSGLQVRLSLLSGLPPLYESPLSHFGFSLSAFFSFTVYLVSSSLFVHFSLFSLSLLFPFSSPISPLPPHRYITCLLFFTFTPFNQTDSQSAQTLFPYGLCFSQGSSEGWGGRRENNSLEKEEEVYKTPRPCMLGRF